jgi:alanine racemase
MKYSISQIAEMLNLPEPIFPLHSISTLLTDSRSLTYPSESLFFALRTRNNDGHRYIKELIERGVKDFIVEEVPTELINEADINFLVVPDVTAALHTIARVHRSHYNIPVIGITGSRGKTTLKEWLYQLLQANYSIVRSPRSYNSQIGVPLSIWEMNRNSELAIFEAGISLKNEMDELQSMIQPTVGILTNIGGEHAEGFASYEEKCHEKMKLFSNCDTII